MVRSIGQFSASFALLTLMQEPIKSARLIGQSQTNDISRFAHSFVSLRIFAPRCSRNSRFSGELGLPCTSLRSQWFIHFWSHGDKESEEIIFFTRRKAASSCARAHFATDLELRGRGRGRLQPLITERTAENIATTAILIHVWAHSEKVQFYARKLQFQSFLRSF